MTDPKVRNWLSVACVSFGIGLLFRLGVVRLLLDIKYPLGGVPADFSRWAAVNGLGEILFYGGGIAAVLLTALLQDRRTARAVTTALDQLEEP
jgi:hypothetical protein